MRQDIWVCRKAGQGIRLTGYHGRDARVEVPERLNGLPVTALGDRLFMGHGELSELILPDTLTTIGEEAFWNCAGLTALHIPEGVSRIGDGAFAGCARLFALNLPEGLTWLGGGALEGCDTLPLVYVPDMLNGAALEMDPFAGYAGRIALKEDHPTLRMRDGVLMTRDGKTLVHYPLTREDAGYTVPEGVERILPCAFQQAKFMAVRVPDSVGQLGAMTFLRCERLITLRISEDCETVEDTVAECPRLEKRLRRIGALGMAR